MPIWIYPFIYSQFHMKLIFTLPIIMIFCNAPFIDSNQTFIFMRSGKRKWLCGQMLYVVTASGIYYLFFIFSTLLSCIALGGEIDFEWGKTLSTIANTNAAIYFGSPYVNVSAYIITYFSPINAVWFTFLLSWLCSTVIGLIIFFCNIVTRTRFLGIVVSSVIIILSALVDTGFSELLYFSPVSWIVLDKVDVGGMTANPSFGYCITVYLVAITLLTAGILIFGKRQSMDVKGN